MQERIAANDVFIGREEAAKVAGLPACWLEPDPAAAGPQKDGWGAYWERLSDHLVLFRTQSYEYVRNLESSMPLDSRSRVLDFGCGFGFVAEKLAPKVGEIFLWDSSSNMRRYARANVAGHRNIGFLDLSTGTSLPEGVRFDLILVNSVVQYMTLDEFSGWLVRWRGMLAPGGQIVISDLIPTDYSSVTDIIDLLKFSARERMLLRTLWQNVGALGRYYSMRHANPLTRVSREELRERGAAAGLAVRFLPRNLTHFKKRITAVFSVA